MTARAGHASSATLATLFALTFACATAGVASSAQTAAAPALHTLGTQGEAELRAQISRNPADAATHYRLASLLFRSNQPKEALAEYTRAAQLQPPTAAQLREVALTYVLLDDYTDADHWMTRSLRMDSSAAEPWYDLGRIKYTENRFAESVDAFQHAIAIAPSLVKAHDNLGLALEGLGRQSDAEKSYRRAIELDHGSAHPSEQPLLNLAILLVNTGAYPEALTLLDRAHTLAPQGSEAEQRIQEQRGRALERLGRLPEAEGALRAAVALKPSSSALHFQLGQLLKREGKSGEAAAEFARVAELRGTKSDENEKKP